MNKLIKCKSCGQDVSPKAKSCPKCGAPVRKKTGCLILIVFVIVCIVAFYYIGSIFAGDNGSTSNQQASSSSSQQPAISLSALYSFPFGANGTWLISEYKNTGNVGILAFKGKWTLVNDLGDSQGGLEDEFTSETPFIETLEGTNTSRVSHHVISPGETIEIIYQVYHYDSGDQQTISATSKENFTAIAVGFGFKNLDDIRSDKKFTFKIEEIVPQ